MFRHRDAIFRESTNTKVYKFDIPLQIKIVIFFLPENRDFTWNRDFT